jgi:hypothetical protein
LSNENTSLISDQDAPITDDEELAGRPNQIEMITSIKKINRDDELSSSQPADLLTFSDQEPQYLNLPDAKDDEQKSVRTNSV